MTAWLYSFRLLAAGILIFSFGCRRAGGGHSSEAASQAPSADQVMDHFSIDSYVSASAPPALQAHGAPRRAGPEVSKDWTLRSIRADIYEKENRIDVAQPHVQFFDKGRPGSELDAGRGRVDTKTNNVDAWDNVVLVSTDGARLNSDWMKYISSLDKIISTAPVTVVRGGSVIRGVGWEAAPNLSQVIIRDQQLEISPEEFKKSK